MRYSRSQCRSTHVHFNQSCLSVSLSKWSCYAFFEQHLVHSNFNAHVTSIWFFTLSKQQRTARSKDTSHCNAHYYILQLLWRQDLSFLLLPEELIYSIWAKRAHLKWKLSLDLRFKRGDRRINATLWVLLPAIIERFRLLD